MGCLGDFCGGNSMWWILILLLILNQGSNTCDSLVWILLLSKFCGNCGETDNGNCGCGCPTNTCGCAR